MLDQVETQPDLIPGPDNDSPITDEKPPKRGPGRPRKDGSPAQPRVAGKRLPGRPRKAATARATRAPARARGSLTLELTGWLNMLNMAFMFMPDLAGDALDQAEIAALASGINDAATANPRVYKALDSVLHGGSSGLLSLAMTVGLIGGRRLARHGIIPETMDTTLGAMIEVQTGIVGSMGNIIFTQPVEVVANDPA